MAFCGKCGAQNADNAVFCKVCGAPLGGAQQGGPGPNNVGAAAGMGAAGAGAAAGAKKNPLAGLDKNKIIGIAAIAVAAILVIVLLSVLLSGGGAKSVVKNLYKAAWDKPDGEKYAKLFHEDVIKDYVDSRGTTRKKWVNEKTSSLKKGVEGLDDEYDKWKYSLKILDVEEVTEERFEKLDEHYDDEYKLSIKKACVVTVKVTWTLDGERQASQITQYTVVKIGSKWYLGYGHLS